MVKPEIEQLAYALKGELTLQERNLLTGAILDSLGALPLRDILYADTDSQELMVSGKPLDFEMARGLRESALAVLNNKAFNLIREQVAFEAQNLAVRKVTTVEELIFARAALWWGEQVIEKLQLLAQQTQRPDA